MASSYPAPVSAVQVGSFFVQQYYHVLQQQPDFVHQFYTDASTIIRIDGESSDTASALLQIHTLVMSLNFTGIEIKTINSLESWSGGVLVVVSGSVKSKKFTGWRKFMQTFLLAPQENGYFVLNDIFHFVHEEVIHQHPAPISDNKVDYQHPTPILSENRVDYQNPSPILQEDRVDYQHPAPEYMENRVDSQLTTSSPHSESPDVPDYEVDTSEHYVLVHIEGDDPVDDYSHHDQQQQEEPVMDVKETPVEKSSALLNEVVREQEPPPAVEEASGEPQKFTYASILQAPKGKTVPSVAVHYPKKASSPTVSEWHQTPEPTSQPANSLSSFVPDSNVETGEEGFSQEGESKSVYVKNLPPTVSTLDIQQEFEHFGRIKPDGVFIRNRKELGVCFAFVEFEDVDSVQNAIKASPIQLVGRQVYIEERRPSSSSNISRGGRRGRGRGSYQNEAVRGRFGGRSFGRGNNQDGSDNYRSRGNGVRGSY